MKSFKQYINENRLSDLHMLTRQGLSIEKVNAILQISELLNIDWRRVKDITNESVEELDERKWPHTKRVKGLYTAVAIEVNKDYPTGKWTGNIHSLEKDAGIWKTAAMALQRKNKTSGSKINVAIEDDKGKVVKLFKESVEHLDEVQTKFKVGDTVKYKGKVGTITKVGSGGTQWPGLVIYLKIDGKKVSTMARDIIKESVEHLDEANLVVSFKTKEMMFERIYEKDLKLKFKKLFRSVKQVKPNASFDITFKGEENELKKVAKYITSTLDRKNRIYDNHHMSNVATKRIA